MHPVHPGPGAMLGRCSNYIRLDVRSGSLSSVALASAHVLLKILNGPYLMLRSVIKNGGLTAPLGLRPLYLTET